MKILIISQYFWPENFKINLLATELKKNGHDITILTSIPNYPGGKFYKGYNFFKHNDEIWEGIKIYRSLVTPRGVNNKFFLLLNYISFVFFSFFKLLKINSNFDKILVYQPSPITVGITAYFAKIKFKAPIYFWVQDLWPQSIVDAGGINNRIILNLINRLTLFIYKNCTVILVQSRAFINFLIDQGVPINKILYFPNPTENFYKVVEQNEFYKKKFNKGFNLIFAGNIGESQSFNTLIDASILLINRNYNIYWNIFGNGRMISVYKKRILDLNIEKFFIFHGEQKSVEMPFYFSCCDGLVVSLKKSYIFSLTIPAKVQSYMACGKPIIASIDGETAKIIIESKSGLVSEAENANTLSESIITLYNMNPQERQKLGENARCYFEKEFDLNRLVKNMHNILSN